MIIGSGLSSRDPLDTRAGNSELDRTGAGVRIHLGDSPAQRTRPAVVSRTAYDVSG